MNLTTRISNRIDTTKNWSEKNPILLYGELGIEFTENNETKVKVGNGKDHWNDLKYVSIDYSLMDEIYSTKKDQLEIEDELKFTQIAVIMVIIMNIVLVCALLCILYA